MRIGDVAKKIVVKHAYNENMIGVPYQFAMVVLFN